MVILNKQEKLELLSGSRSGKLRNDFEQMRKNSELRLGKQGGIGLSALLKFLTVSNALSSHVAKPFKKMSGKNFKL